MSNCQNKLGAPVNTPLFCEHEYGWDVLEFDVDHTGYEFGWTHDGGDRYDVKRWFDLEKVIAGIEQAK